jgi:CheY-like chemotaxis protein
MMPDDFGDLAAARRDLSTASARFCAAADRLTSRLDRWTETHGLARRVLLVDDSGPALLALASALHHVGAEVHACAHDDDTAAALVSAGVTVHRVHCCGDAAAVWRRTRAAVVVVDAHLGGVCGGDVLSQIGRGPRAVLVSSRVDQPEDRAGITAAARLAHATAVLRTDSGEWAARLRDAVLAALDDALPPAVEAP